MYRLYNSNATNPPKTCAKIYGPAGTGKTTILNAIQTELKKRNLNWRAFLPTNKGANLIGGKTIHSVYYKYKSRKANLFRVLEKTDYIFIDEVSMMIKDFYQLFTMIKRTFKNIKGTLYS